MQIQNDSQISNFKVSKGYNISILARIFIISKEFHCLIFLLLQATTSPSKFLALYNLIFTYLQESLFDFLFELLIYFSFVDEKLNLFIKSYLLYRFLEPQLFLRLVFFNAHSLRFALKVFVGFGPRSFIWRTGILDVNIIILF